MEYFVRTVILGFMQNAREWGPWCISFLLIIQSTHGNVQIEEWHIKVLPSFDHSEPLDLDHTLSSIGTDNSSIQSPCGAQHSIPLHCSTPVNKPTSYNTNSKYLPMPSYYKGQYAKNLKTVTVNCQSVKKEKLRLLFFVIHWLTLCGTLKFNKAQPTWCCNHGIKQIFWLSSLWSTFN